MLLFRSKNNYFILDTSTNKLITNKSKTLQGLQNLVISNKELRTLHDAVSEFFFIQICSLFTRK